MDQVQKRKEFLEDVARKQLESEENQKVIDDVMRITARIRYEALDRIEEAKAEERQRIIEVLDSLISDVQKRVLTNKINSSEALGAGVYLLKAKKALEVE